MLTETPVAATVKKTSRRVAKSTSKQVEKTTKTAVYLSSKSAQKLRVTSAMTLRTQSEIIDELISLHLKRFTVSDREKASAEDCADQAMMGVSAES